MDRTFLVNGTSVAIFGKRGDEKCECHRQTITASLPTCPHAFRQLAMYHPSHLGTHIGRQGGRNCLVGWYSHGCHVCVLFACWGDVCRRQCTWHMCARRHCGRVSTAGTWVWSFQQLAGSQRHQPQTSWLSTQVPDDACDDHTATNKAVVLNKRGCNAKRLGEAQLTALVMW